jgi:hypothetical protein
MTERESRIIGSDDSFEDDFHRRNVLQAVDEVPSNRRLGDVNS